MGREILELTPPPAEVRIAYGEGANQFADLRRPHAPGPHPVAILIHGGFWRAAFNLEYMGHVAAALTQYGIATWNIEYRRIGQEGGGYPGTLDDVAAAALHLPRIAHLYDLDLSRAIAVGHSAGGHLALWLATSKPGIPLRCAVSLAGVADLARAYDLKLSNTVAGEFLGGSPASVPDRYRAASPIENLPCGTPLLLVHGDQDEVVPIEIAEGFETAARNAGDDCRLLRLAGADHFDPVDPRSRAWPGIEQAIRLLL